jgi:hypothetical protein
VNPYALPSFATTLPFLILGLAGLLLNPYEYGIDRPEEEGWKWPY